MLIYPTSHAPDSEPLHGRQASGALIQVAVTERAASGRRPRSWPGHVGWMASTCGKSTWSTAISQVSSGGDR